MCHHLVWVKRTVVTNTSRASDFKAMKMPKTFTATLGREPLCSSSFLPSKSPTSANSELRMYKDWPHRWGSFPRGTLSTVWGFLYSSSTWQREKILKSESQRIKRPMLLTLGSTLMTYKVLLIHSSRPILCESWNCEAEEAKPLPGRWGRGSHIKAAEAEFKSRPGSRPVLCPQAHWWQNADREALEAWPALSEHSCRQQEVAQLMLTL